MYLQVLYLRGIMLCPIAHHLLYSVRYKAVQLSACASSGSVRTAHDGVLHTAHKQLCSQSHSAHVHAVAAIDALEGGI